jgi:thiol-disulfide isomerase/thioredoxin
MYRSLCAPLLVALATTPLIACDKATKAKVNKALGRYRAYDDSVDGKKQIADAVAKAKASNKRVLVQFGGNWCVFCKALDELIDGDATLKALHERYVSIHVDAGSNPALDDVYGKPYDHGFPVLLVLDGDGALLHTQPSTAFQLRTAVGHDPAGVAAFLKQWAAP